MRLNETVQGGILNQPKPLQNKLRPRKICWGSVV